MPSLDHWFREVRLRLERPDGLNPAQANPLFYLVHDPNQTIEVKGKVHNWATNLESDGYTPIVKSFADLIWDTVAATCDLDELIQIEQAHAGSEEGPQPIWSICRESVAGTLEAEQAFLHAFAEIQSKAPDNAVILMTDVAALHPYIRVRSIENHPTSRPTHPTVIFYPGRRSGQYGLHFLDIYDNDPNYRSVMIGGQA